MDSVSALAPPQEPAPGSEPFAATGNQVPADPLATFPSSAFLRLPNGMTVVPQSRVEAEHFYEDIFERQIYLRHGITLRPGDCVFDVGGNIGTFALFAGRHAPGGRIYTFEPAPALFARLRANLELNGTAARAFNHGIAEEERTARFTFYPNSPGMSSFYANADEERAVLRRMMDREREAGLEGMNALMEYTEELLDERFHPVEMECRLRPLSAVIREEGVEQIDLLKVDVQKAELDVLRGLADEHWPRIRQVVMEVHDLDGRLGEISRLLEARGFSVAVEQDEAVEGTVLYNLFAVNRAFPPREPDPSRAVRGESGAGAGKGTTGANPWRLLVLSAPSPQALDAATARLARHLAENPALPLAGVAATLREQPALPHRRTFIVRDGEDASARLAGRDPTRVADGIAADGPSVVFLFPGVGELYPGMARGLYEAEPVFRAEMDRCASILRRHLDFDVREALFTAEGKSDPVSGGIDLRRMLGRAPTAVTAHQLSRTEVAQPAAFAVGYALARLWESWGIRPAALLGHSLGEYTAACVAGVFTLEDALETVALRARAIQALPAGAMLAVSLAPEAVAPWLGDGVALAAVNAPELCVLSGPVEAIARAEHSLAAAGHVARRLATTHAFHSPSMQPAAEQVSALAARMRLSPPRIPLLSNVTGGWLTPAEATDPSYWVRHLVGTVLFARATEELLGKPGRVLVELGPGGSLGTFVRQQAASGTPVPPGVASLPHAAEDAAEPGFVLHALGRLWTTGVQVNWTTFPDQESSRVCLPLAASKGPVSAEGATSTQEHGPDELLREIAAIWGELLGVEASPEDDFFLLGGHSLVATRLIARVRERFGVEMRLRTLFQTRTVSGMADWIRHAASHV